MTVKVVNNEMFIRVSFNPNSLRLQDMLDYLNYVELTANSTATQETVEKLVNNTKKDDGQK